MVRAVGNYSQVAVIVAKCLCCNYSHMAVRTATLKTTFCNISESNTDTNEKKLEFINNVFVLK